MRTTRMLITISLAALALTAAACGGSDGSAVASLSGSSTTDTTLAGGGGSAASGVTAEFEDAMVAFAKCMRDNGVDFPDPSGGALIIGPDSDIDPETSEFKAAEAECKPILEEAEKSMPQPSEEELASMRDQMLAFAQCMREEGIDFPDPVFGEGGTMHSRQPVHDDPDFKEAEEACSKKTGGIGISRAAPRRGNDR